MRRKILNAWDEVRDTPRNVLRILAWIPILWRDRDWDSCYLYLIMAFKLERMRERFKYEDRHLSTPKDVKDMDICIEILRRKDGNRNEELEREQRDLYCSCEDRDVWNEKYMKPSECGRWTSWQPPPLCKSCRFHMRQIYGKREKEQWELFCDIFKRKSESWWT